MKYEEILLEKLENIAFLELKDNSSINIDGVDFYGPIPLPILSENLIKIVKDEVEDVPVAMVIEGIVNVFGLAPNYEYAEVYFEILEAYVSDVNGYIQKLAFEKLDSEDFIGSLIYLKALKNLGFEDEKTMFALGNSLENFDISSFSDEDKMNHALEIMRVYEEILNLNPEFSLASYKLGYIYKEFGQFIKSKISFEKSLALDLNDFRKQEIREVLDSMEDDVLLERAILLMEKNEYEYALKILSNISSDGADDVVYYHISLCHYNLGNIEAGVNAIDEAIAMNDLAIYHNQLALLYDRSGDSSKAMEELENTIDKNGPDYLLNYNLATIQYNLGYLDSAITNFEIAYDKTPNEQLKEIIDFLKENNAE